MRISDWSSDVCSSDLYMRVPDIAAQLDALRGEACRPAARGMRLVVEIAQVEGQRVALDTGIFQIDRPVPLGRHADRKRVVSGKSVAVRVDLGGRRNIKKQKHSNN